MNKLEKKTDRIIIDRAISDVMNKNHEHFGEYLDYFSKHLPSYDYKYYLYLMSIIADLPANYKLEAKSIHEGELFISIKDEQNAQTNLIRSLAFSQKFYKAIGQIIERSRYVQLIGQDKLEMRLLLEAKAHLKEVITKEKEHIMSGDLQAAVNVIIEESTHHRLKKSQIIYLFILKDILSIEVENILPLSRGVENGYDVYDYVIARDYEQALKKNIENTVRKGVASSDDITGMLLRRVISSKNRLIETQRTRSVDYFPQIRDDDLLPAILTALLGRNIKKANILLKTYIERENLQDYDYLIQGLKKIALLENDETFMDLMVTISGLVMDKFKMDISKYLDCFEFYLKKGEPKIAYEYLRIITTARQKGHSELESAQIQKRLVSIKSSLEPKL